MRRLITFNITLMIVLMMGCQTNFDAGESLPEKIASPSELPYFTPQPGSQTQGETMTPPTPDMSGMESLIALARNHLARKLSISVDEINLVEAKPVVWPDSSMGCPQPGMAYLQVPEDGALIILQFNGISYEYHNGGSRGLFLCESNSRDPAITPNPGLFNLTPSKSDPPPTTPDNSIPPGEDT